MRVSARDFNRVFDGLGAAIQQNCFLREVAGRQCIQLFRQRDIFFVGRDAEAGVDERVELLADRCRPRNRGSDCRPRLPELRLQRARRKSAWRDRRRAALRPDGVASALEIWGLVWRCAVGSWACQYHPIGCSFRLMCTCLVSRYSSMPQGPSSRPNPDCLYPPQGASTYVGCM
jgi:hypothetical protein